MFDEYKSSIDFKIVYIRDTHPLSGFRAPTNDRRGISPDEEPKTLADRERWACQDRTKMTCTIPIVMDTMDDKTMITYGAFPQRLYVIDRNAKVVYRSTDLVGFARDELTAVLERLARSN